jgi:MoxR-like ATPase
MPLNVSSTNPDTRVELASDVLNNMRDGLSNIRLMLAGDPGIGKTSFVQQFSQLVGMELMLIEVPHIVEEHVINVPFILFNGKGNSKKRGNLQFDASEYEVVLAKSNLASLLDTAKQVSTPELLRSIYNNKNLKYMHEALGGTETTLPKKVAEVRQKYSCILFIDEYFRKTSVQIRNMLRGILNGEIGLDKMPKNCYPMYASNMVDGDSVERVPTNQDFQIHDMEAPTKDSWFKYLIAKFEDDQHVKLNMAVINKFRDILEDSDMSHNHSDLDAEVRTSPRRWEEILLYVNAAIPVEDEKDAADLLSNLKTMFSDYKTNGQSDLWPKVEKAVRQLITETSGVEPGEATQSDNWRSALEHQIKQKMKLGNNRKYVPVVSGPPGIGKSAEAFEIARKLHLRLIRIDCSTLSADAVIGMPIPHQKSEKKDDLGVNFATPQLFISLNNKIKEADEEYRTNPDYNPKYENARWKYLIFFDELNRTKNVNVFNALRKLLLDKRFTPDTITEDGETVPGLKLPEESIVVAAINPSDAGTLKLTSHMTDVLDILQSQPSWSGLESFIMKEAKSSENVKKALFSILADFTEAFSARKNDNVPKDARRFYFDIGGGDGSSINDQLLYVSPREFTSIFGAMQVALNDLVEDNDVNAKSLEADPVFAKEVFDEADKAIYKSFEKILKNCFLKIDSNAKRFLNDQLRVWSKTVNPIKAMVTQKVNIASFADVVNRYFHDHTMSVSDESELITYFKAVSITVYNEDLLDFLKDKYKDNKTLIAHFFDTPAKKKERVGREISHMDEETSLLENFIRDLIHAMRIHKIDNEFVNITLETFNEFLDKLGDLYSEMLDEMEDQDYAMDLQTKAMAITMSINKFLFAETGGVKK